MDNQFLILLTVHSTTCQGNFSLWTAVPLLELCQWFMNVVLAANYRMQNFFRTWKEKKWLPRSVFLSMTGH